MQRHLYLCRHADAQDAFLLQSDFERELTPEGIRQAHETGKWLREHYIKTDAVISSPARRANATACIVAGRLYFDEEKITYDPEIYNPREAQLLNSISKLPDAVHSVLLVSHNPALSQLLRNLTNRKVAFLEPGQVAVLALDLTTWQDIYIAEARLLDTNLQQQV